MKNNHTDIYDLFLRHSQKELSENELNDFCERLVNDEDFKNQFEEYEISRQFLIQKELFEIDEIINDFNNNPPLTKSNSYKYWLGGSLLFTFLVIGIGTAFLPKDSSDEIEQTNSITNITVNTSKNTENDNATLPNIVDNNTSQPLEEQHIKNDPIIDQSITPSSNTPSSITSNNNLSSTNEKEIQLVVVNTPTIVKEKVTNSTTKESITELEPTDTSLPCPTISFSTITEKACREEATGSIKIQNIKGGKSPYQFMIEDEQISTPKFHDLEAGTYQVTVKDDNGCLNTQLTIISSKTCINKHYEFAYSYQDSWTIPVTQNGTISFYNQQGKKVVSLTLEEDVETEWNGMDLNGNTLPTGLYPFVIELENEKLSGSLSIYP